MSGLRWKKIEKTTPSGKVLFRCDWCGRESPTPDKVCPTGCGAIKPCCYAECERPALWNINFGMSWAGSSCHEHLSYMLSRDSVNVVTVVASQRNPAKSA